MEKSETHSIARGKGVIEYTVKGRVILNSGGGDRI